MEIERITNIVGFPAYEITSHGRVFNKYGREMVLTPNTQGELTVGLVRYGRQIRFSVKCLVARHFVKGESDIFNTPIYLDGDVHNLHASNIVWRPRWFAWKYKRQFITSPAWYTAFRVVDLVDQVEYENIADAAVKNGLLCYDIFMSIHNENVVFPTEQLFTYVL